jgi:protein TonB
MTYFLKRIPKLVLLGSLALALTSPALAQQVTTPTRTSVYSYVEQPPQLVGTSGTAAIAAMAERQLVYPARALRDGLTGKVFVNISVAPDGLITDTKVVRGLRPDCDSATLLAVQQLPRLKPAYQNGRAVYYNFTLPINFQPSASPSHK